MLEDEIIYDKDYFTITKHIVLKRKTPIYYIFSKLSATCIGTIKWYGAWRKFCFFPENETIWDTKCLLQLQTCLDEINIMYIKGE